MSDSPIKITIADVEGRLIDTCRDMLQRFDFVGFHQGSILELECDAIVSPANSFGFMDGGIDLIYSEFFGWHVQKNLQAMIREKHFGELLVGNAEIVGTGHDRIPYIIAAPTMRVPMVLHKSVNAYLAARAIFILIQNGIYSDGPLAGKPLKDHVRHIAMPGLGTGSGAIPPAAFARQLRAAIDGIILEKREFPQTWRQAGDRHVYMYVPTVT